MIRLFLVGCWTDDAAIFDRELFRRSLLTLSTMDAKDGGVHDWIHDCHPIETAIVVGIAESAPYAADLADLAGLARHPNSALLVVSCAGLTHPIRSRLPVALGGARTPLLPDGLPGAVVTDPMGGAGWRGNLRRLPPTWEHRETMNGPPDYFDAIARAIRRVDKSRSKGINATVIRERPRSAGVRFLPPINEPATA